MLRFTHSLGIAATVAALCVPGHAQTPASSTGTAAALRVSTLGIGAEISQKLAPTVDGRLGFNDYSYHRDSTFKQIAYDGHLKLNTVTALADIYAAPRSTFHFTAGLAINNNKLSGNGKPSGNGNYTINGHTYTVAQVGTLSADATFSHISPYFGIGFGRATSSKSPLQVLLDLGVLLQGKPNLSVTATGAVASPALASDIAVQRARTQSDLNKLNIYPVVSLGIAYHL